MTVEFVLNFLKPDNCQLAPIPMPSWEVIESDKGKYIDLGRLPTQVRLGNPDELTDTEVSVLVAVIQTSGDVPPFMFRTQSVGIDEERHDDTITHSPLLAPEVFIDLTVDHQPTTGRDDITPATTTCTNQGDKSIQDGIPPEPEVVPVPAQQGLFVPLIRQYRAPLMISTNRKIMS